MALTLIRNGTVIDGTGAAPRPNTAVLLDGNHIAGIGTAAEMQQIADSRAGDVTTIDAGGGTILPGFVDAHVHMMLEGINIPRLLTTPFSFNFYKSIEYMRRTLDAGVTTVRDAGGADAGMKAAIDQGVVAGPRMQISVVPMTITGGHGDGWQRSGQGFELMVPHPGMPDGRCNGVEEVRAKVREILRAGADVLKVHATGGVLSPTDHPEFTQFSPEELAVMVQEGEYRRGVKVMAHAQGSEGIKNAVLAGIHSIEHGIFLTPEVIDLMLEHGTYVVPTLLAPVGVLEAGEAGGMPEYGLRKAREVVEIHAESIAAAHQAGVRIAMGTDSAVTPHGQNLRELGLMVNIGMTPMEAIVATTHTAAECMGWDDRIGTLEVGKLADVVIASTDPIKDIRSMENNDNIVVVIKDGVVVKDLLN